MNDNVLFVNRDRAVIREFLNAMQDYTFEVDTADSGLEAAALLKKKVYKVVITGMNLSVYDGTKLIAYLNKYCPKTACIVYTTRIDLAQLHLLVNKREVFRIFLKPVNYRGDFYHAIQDGFTYYDVKEAAGEERKALEAKTSIVADIAEGSIRLPAERLDWSQVKRLLYPILRWTVQEFDSNLSKEEQRVLVEYEQSILDYYLKEDYEACLSLEALKARVYKEFIKDSRKQEIEIRVNRTPVNPDLGFYEKMHFIIWLLVRQIAAVSLTYKIVIDMDFQIPFHAKFQIHGKVGRKALEACMADEFCQKCGSVIFHTVESIADRCRQEVSEDTISYSVALKTEYRKRNV